MAEPIDLLFGLQTRVGHRKHYYMGAQILHAKKQFLGKSTCLGMPDGTLP